MVLAAWQKKNRTESVGHAAVTQALSFPVARGYSVVTWGSELSLRYCCTIDPSAI